MMLGLKGLTNASARRFEVFSINAATFQPSLAYSSVSFLERITLEICRRYFKIPGGSVLRF